MKARKKILVFSHAVTMAHFTRPLKLIERLDPATYEIYVASDPRFRNYFDEKAVTFIGIKCIDPTEFAETVGRAGAIYDSNTFENHIAEDLRVMQAIKPDIVLGDFRHSLSVSCRLQKIKYVNITNAYWSPDIKMTYPLPESPAVRQIGRIGEKFVHMLVAPILPLILKFNFFKMSFVLRKHFQRVGLSFRDYRQVITDGDITAYCDTSEVVPLRTQSAKERFVGPMVWSVNVPLPSWWSKLDPKKKRVFLTLGSSGPSDSLPLIITALSSLNLEVIVALAGNTLNLLPLPNVHIADYLPIKEACENSDLVVCNGGSPVCHAALTYGVPTIGIVCNNDQLLNMIHIQNREAGILLRYWNLTARKVTDAAMKILNTPSYADQSAKIQSEFESVNALNNLEQIIDEVLNGEVA